MSALTTILGAVVVMEVISYLSHRFVMHRFGMGLHRSHHQAGGGGFERNDLYPLMFSALAIAAFAVGTSLPSARILEVAGGVTLYGALYGFVHEVYIHRRLPISPRRARVLELLKRCHRVHHLYGGEPYGMLIPYVPRDLRSRAALVDRDPFARPPKPAEAVSG